MSKPNERETIVDWLDKNLPPFACYAEARKYPRGPWAGPGLIAERSGLSPRTVQRIGAKISWDGVDIGAASVFIRACGFQISGWGLIALNRLKTYRRYLITKAIRPMAHLDEKCWKCYSKRAAQWLKWQNQLGNTR